MKTVSFLLAAAPLVAGILLPDDQQVLSLSSGDETNSHQQQYTQVINADSHSVFSELPLVSGYHIAKGLQKATVYGERTCDHGPKKPHVKDKKCPNSKHDREMIKKGKENHKSRGAMQHEHYNEHYTGDIFDKLPHHKRSFFDKVKGHLKHMFWQYTHGKPQTNSHKQVYKQTIYQLISSSKHTRILTQIINQYDEVVQQLNSTESKYTLFVPVDEAFKHVHHRPESISKADVLSWLKYHASPKVLTVHDFFDVQTVSTLLGDEFPTRISTQVGFKGLLLNFHSRVIRPNIIASNGVIHGINQFLVPPLPLADTIDLAPSIFSTLNLALIKTRLIDKISGHNGTFFAPSNHAFEKLGPKVNAFLFSRGGEKYLKALLKYHIVQNHTVFSDAYYHSSTDINNATSDKHGLHLDLPTLLHGEPIAVDIHHVHRLTHILLNKKTHVSVPNVPVREGVVHIIKSVIVPPRPAELVSGSKHKLDGGPNDDCERGQEHDEKEYKHKCKHSETQQDDPAHAHLNVPDLMIRLEPFIE